MLLGAATLNADDGQVMAEYADKANAVEHINRLRSEGRYGEIRVVRLPVYVKRLEVGYYASRQQAQAIAQALQDKGVTSTQIVEGQRGYAVSIGAFVDPKNLIKQQYRLKNYGFGNTHVISGEIEREMYQVVMLPTPPPLPTGAPKSEMTGQMPAAPPVISGGRAVGRRIVPYLFYTREEAEDKVSQLAAEGGRVSMETLQFKTLQMRYYRHRSDAERVVSILKQYNIGSRLITDKSGRGYAVMVTDRFIDQEEMDRRFRQLQYIGFDNVRIAQVPAYLVNHSVDIAPAEEQGEMLAFPMPAEEAQGAGGEVLVFGDSMAFYDGLSLVPSEDSKTYHIALAEARLEGGVLSDSSQSVDGSHYLHAEVIASWNPARSWELQLDARLDAYDQTGLPEYDDSEADYGDSFIRYRGESYRLTLGAQTVIWGRVDELPPTDRMSVQDLTRHVLDDLADRRRAVPAIRMEKFFGANKLDMLWVPVFREAELPDMASIWSPVDKVNGRIIGTTPSPLLQPLVQVGTFAEEDDDTGGFGLRYSRTGKGVDYAVTLQRARHSQPYYELNRDVRGVLLSTLNPAQALAATSDATFIARHPQTWVAGGDLGFEAGEATWRFELAYLSDMPVTLRDLRMETTEAVDWVAGVEFYPGGAGTRINLQLAGHHLLEDENILDRDHLYNFNGSSESLFAHDRWRFSFNFIAGIDQRDVYLNPELSYLGWEPSEIYAAFHYFSGDAGTLGGFHEDHGLGMLGWRIKY